MPKIESAEQATDIAVSFLKKHYTTRQEPLTVRPEQGYWVVEVDVGAFLARIARVIINGETGEIFEFQVQPPALPSPPAPLPPLPPLPHLPPLR